MPPADRPPLRAVFFDAGNTLIRMDYGAIAAHLARHGVRTDAAAVQHAEWRARVRLDDDLRARPASTESRDTADRYLGYLLDGLGVGDRQVVAAVAAWRRGYNPPVGLWTAPEPTAAEALEAVRAAGVRAAVISNSNGAVRAILATHGLTALLDFVIDSSEVGLEKPDPAIFRLALARAGVSPAEAAYVGDLYSVDVLGARTAGLRAVLLDPGAHWGPRDCPRAPDTLAAVRLLV
jgi:putative hydrolase of the HAD superfamily